LNEDSGYVHRFEEWKWVPGALDALALLQAAGFRLIVVTNQSGIGRGLFTEAQFRELTRWMRHEALAKGVWIDHVSWCPTHPTEALDGFRYEDPRRKPNSGMLLEAIQRFGLDPAACVMIGDRETDLMAAAGAGVPGYQFSGGNLGEFVRDTILSSRTPKTGRR
jgi:D-glycero-D-manno-heptose 1,7-bisphosphate phosphatase